MEMSKCMVPGVVLAVFIVVASACAPTTEPPGAPQADLKWPPVGAAWVQEEKSSGSFGSATERRTWTFIGEQTWDGNKVMAFSDGTVTNYTDARRRLIATVRGTQLVERYEPYYATAEWPLFVGKQWVRRYTYRDQARGRSFNDLQQDAKVEAYEDVKVPAGTFKAFRIGGGDPHIRITGWYSPELGLFVKNRTERLATYYLGAGVREMEVVSYDFMR